MKLHRNLAEAAVETLEQIFKENRVAEREVQAAFEANKKWGARDRAWFAETVYEIVRWRRLLEFAVQSEQIWALLGAHLLRNANLPEWDEFAAFDVDATRERLNAANLPRAARESLPDWLDELGESELGERWGTEIAALNQSAPVVLRANTLRNSRDELQIWLRENGVETSEIPSLPDALQLEKRANLGRFLKSGRFEVQDAASQLVAPFLKIEAGQNFVDACAGAGGKTLHAGALMKNEGRILACDVNARKLEIMEARSRRAGVEIVRTEATRREIRAKFANFADRILIDAPCSGLGTLRRQPDLKWRLTPEFVARIQATQREILSFNAPLLRSGGLLVYATCSILPSENEAQIEWFLSENAGFELEEQKRIWTSATGWDGFFMARLRRN